jgi:hypothetical protein
LLEVIAEDVDGYLGAGAAPAAHHKSRAAEDAPHHLDDALALSLQPTRGAHLLKTTVDVEFEHFAGSYGGRPVTAGEALAKPNSPNFSRAMKASITRRR